MSKPPINAPDEAASIRCIVCSKTLAQVLHEPGWSDHLHAWDDPDKARRIIGRDEAGV